MTKKSKNYLKYSLLVLIILIIVGIARDISKVNDFLFNSIKNEDSKYLHLFKNDIRRNLELKSANRNPYEDIFIYSYKQKYNLVVWNISGYNNINPENIALASNSEFEREGFTSEFKLEFGTPKVEISSSLEKKKTDTLTIQLNDDYEILNYKRQKDLLFLNFKSKGILLSQGTYDLKAKIFFEEQNNFQTVFLNDKSQFLIITLIPIDSSIIETENLLYDILFGINTNID